jgi:RNA polymerase sigma-70 factor, ECF subfamily
MEKESLQRNYPHGSSRDHGVREDDLVFITQCRKGDVDAFQMLVERYQKRMLNTAYRMLDDYEEACEIVQESFLSAYKALPHFRGDATFSSWITTIVMNHSRNRLKQKKIRRRHEFVYLDAPVETEDGAVPVEIPSQDCSAHEILAKRELERRVQDCINALDNEHKDVVILRDMQGFSYDEISSMLNLADGTVKSRLFRARNSLRDCLADVLDHAEVIL